MTQRERAMATTVAQLQEAEGHWLKELNDANAARAAIPFFENVWEKQVHALRKEIEEARSAESAWEKVQMMQLIQSHKREHERIVNGGRKAEIELSHIRERMNSLGHTAKLKSA